MLIRSDTSCGNASLSAELEQLLLDLANQVHETYEIVKKIWTKAREEGFNDSEIRSLLRYRLSKFLDRNQVNYILYVKDQRKQKKENKMLTNQRNDSKNVPSIPAPDYNMISVDQNKVYEDAIEDLRLQLKDIQAKLDQTLADKKQLEEKCAQLETNNMTTKVTKLKAKVVVNQLFRDVLQVKGSKYIYSYIVVDTSQNRYIGLEPIQTPLAVF